MTVATPSSNYMDGSPNSILSKFIKVVLHILLYIHYHLVLRSINARGHKEWLIRRLHSNTK